MLLFSDFIDNLAVGGLVEMTGIMVLVILAFGVGGLVDTTVVGSTVLPSGWVYGTLL